APASLTSRMYSRTGWYCWALLMEVPTRRPPRSTPTIVGMAMRAIRRVRTRQLRRANELPGLGRSRSAGASVETGGPGRSCALLRPESVVGVLTVATSRLSLRVEGMVRIFHADA